MSARSEATAVERQKHLDRVNVAHAKYDAARARVQTARSELGTATSLLARAAAELIAAADDLAASLPSTPEVAAERTRLAETAREATGLLELGQALEASAPGSAS